MSTASDVIITDFDGLASLTFALVQCFLPCMQFSLRQIWVNLQHLLESY